MYRAVLFAPDGDWVTDYPRDSIEEVQEALADQCSRWYFYPFHGVIRCKAGLLRSSSRLVDVAPPFEHLAGRSIGTMGSTIAAMPEYELEAIVS